MIMLRLLDSATLTQNENVLEDVSIGSLSNKCNDLYNSTAPPVLSISEQKRETNVTDGRVKIVGHYEFFE